MTLTLPFTLEYDNVLKFLTSLDLGGGKDEAEAVVDGLDEALHLNWESKNKKIILFTDSVSHGTPGLYLLAKTD